eukprot:m.38400 g.38400  ORF g.38400 m.38400 type:complete len:1456 (+) comp11181_c0_seq1:1803-6170(+)
MAENDSGGSEFADSSTSNSDSNSGDDNAVPLTYELNPTFSALSNIGVYGTKSRLYVVGSDRFKRKFRVMQIDRTDPRELHITDDGFEYTKEQVDKMLRMIDASARTSVLERGVSAFGILGFVRFLCGYYLILITSRRRVAMIGSHYIYSVKDTSVIPIPASSIRLSHPNETKYLKMFQNIDLSSNFYFSYTYDVSRPLQANMSVPCPSGASAPVTIRPDQMFVWNYELLTPIAGRVHPHWLLPVTHGFIGQSNLSVFGKSIYITLIARRSRHYAGTRFLKRGVNHLGYVANDVESEQIVHDATTLDHSHGRYTSFVQVRGSVPTFWAQDNSGMKAKPPIHVARKDPFYTSAAFHFDRLFKKYGSPVIVLNLVKRKEKKPRESILSDELSSAIRYLTQFLPKNAQIEYLPWDMAKCAKSKDGNVFGRLEEIASRALQTLGFFHAGPELTCNRLASEASPRAGGLDYGPDHIGRNQLGVLRVNCVDCLDRTNTTQFGVGLVALRHQLRALGIVKTVEKSEIPFDSDCCRLVEELYEDHGDTIALQYGGSQLVNRIRTYRKLSPWTSHSRDILQTVTRYYSNAFTDLEKQAAINVFLGVYKPSEHTQDLWDFETDHFLHVWDVASAEAWPRPDYRQWWTANFDAPPRLHRFVVAKPLESSPEASRPPSSPRLPGTGEQGQGQRQMSVAEGKGGDAVDLEQLQPQHGLGKVEVAGGDSERRVQQDLDLEQPTHGDGGGSGEIGGAADHAMPATQGKDAAGMGLQGGESDHGSSHAVDVAAATVGGADPSDLVLSRSPNDVIDSDAILAATPARPKRSVPSDGTATSQGRGVKGDDAGSLQHGQSEVAGGQGQPQSTDGGGTDPELHGAGVDGSADSGQLEDSDEPETSEPPEQALYVGDSPRAAAVIADPSVTVSLFPAVPSMSLQKNRAKARANYFRVRRRVVSSHPVFAGMDTDQANKKFDSEVKQLIASWGVHLAKAEHYLTAVVLVAARFGCHFVPATVLPSPTTDTRALPSATDFWQHCRHPGTFRQLYSSLEMASFDDMYPLHMTTTARLTPPAASHDCSPFEARSSGSQAKTPYFEKFTVSTQERVAGLPQDEDFDSDEDNWDDTASVSSLDGAWQRIAIRPAIQAADKKQNPQSYEAIRLATPQETYGVSLEPLPAADVGIFQRHVATSNLAATLEQPLGASASLTGLDSQYFSSKSRPESPSLTFRSDFFSTPRGSSSRLTGSAASLPPTPLPSVTPQRPRAHRLRSPPQSQQHQAQRQPGAGAGRALSLPSTKSSASWPQASQGGDEGVSGMVGASLMTATETIAAVGASRLASSVSCGLPTGARPTAWGVATDGGLRSLAPLRGYDQLSSRIEHVGQPSLHARRHEAQRVPAVIPHNADEAEPELTPSVLWPWQSVPEASVETYRVHVETGKHGFAQMLPDAPTYFAYRHSCQQFSSYEDEAYHIVSA